MLLHIILTHWGRVTHICVVELTIIDSDNGLSPGRRQAIIWTNAGVLSIGPLGTNFSEILFEIYTFSFKKMHLKMSSAKWRPFCFGLNVLTNDGLLYWHIRVTWPQHSFQSLISVSWQQVQSPNLNRNGPTRKLRTGNPFTNMNWL